MNSLNKVKKSPKTGSECVDDHIITMELIKRKARQSIIKKTSTLPKSMIDWVYENTHGGDVQRGPLRTSPSFILKSSKKLKEATMFLFFFRLEFKNFPDDGFSKNVINAYDRYKKFVSIFNQSNSSTITKINISEAWQIATFNIEKSLFLVKCQYCKSSKIYIVSEPFHACPVCKN
ncbi:FlhC family transcriptional regulator [Methylomonas sp. AM2-LC]|uniref:FlhC family transcriptional regulator n=1 Tax=Methylomonas sp. AM2-LC TaxID=3153301 RepID=UPI003267CDD2